MEIEEMNMKRLMLGNEAVARGLYESGCGFVCAYPGTPSTEIAEYAAKFPELRAEWAPNEKVALEAAFGASLAGSRSFCAMKHVGLNVAADPLFTLSYTGVNAGLVLCVADDPGMHSSQNEQDSRNYALAAKLPLLEPSDSAEALEFTKAAFELSEEFDTPVILRMCTRVSHSRSIVEPGRRKEPVRKAYQKDPSKYVMMPGFSRKRHPCAEERLKRLSEYAETSSLNRWERGRNGKYGIVTSGTAYQYVKEACGDEFGVLKLGLGYPFPDRLLKDFADSAETLIVAEELDDFIETHCRKIGLDAHGKDIFPSVGELSQNMAAEKLLGRRADVFSPDRELPQRPPMMCAGCPHRGLFHVLSKLKLTVIGDIGCYTLGATPPLNAIDSVLCMGASVSGLHGFNRAGGGENEGKTVAVIGDSTFIHSGVTGLIHIAYNASNSTVIILDNSITAMTGHQQNPATGYNLKGEPAPKLDLEGLCRAVGIKRVRAVDPYRLDDCESAVREELNAKEPSVIISRRPCVLLKGVGAGTPLTVDADKCRGCKSCLKIGCPALSMKDGLASIDASLCTGCGVCTQLCGFDAIKKSEVEA